MFNINLPYYKKIKSYLKDKIFNFSQLWRGLADVRQFLLQTQIRISNNNNNNNNNDDNNNNNDDDDDETFRRPNSMHQRSRLEPFRTELETRNPIHRSLLLGSKSNYNVIIGQRPLFNDSISTFNLFRSYLILFDQRFRYQNDIFCLY